MRNNLCADCLHWSQVSVLPLSKLHQPHHNLLHVFLHVKNQNTGECTSHTLFEKSVLLFTTDLALTKLNTSSNTRLLYNKGTCLTSVTKGVENSSKHQQQQNQVCTCVCPLMTLQVKRIGELLAALPALQFLGPGPWGLGSAWLLGWLDPGATGSVLGEPLLHGGQGLRFRNAGAPFPWVGVAGEPFFLQAGLPCRGPILPTVAATGKGMLTLYNAGNWSTSLATRDVSYNMNMSL